MQDKHTDPDATSAPDPAAAQSFIEQMGLMCEADQLPRISGRILGLFLIVGTPLSLGSVAERLRVSRASASANLRLLADAGILERVGIPNDRQDYYRLAPNPFQRLLTGIVARLRRGSAFFAEAAETLPLDNSEGLGRLRDLAEFHDACAHSLDQVLKSYSHEQRYFPKSTRDDSI